MIKHLVTGLLGFALLVGAFFGGRESLIHSPFGDEVLSAEEVKNLETNIGILLGDNYRLARKCTSSGA